MLNFVLEKYYFSAPEATADKRIGPAVGSPNKAKHANKPFKKGHGKIWTSPTKESPVKQNPAEARRKRDKSPEESPSKKLRGTEEGESGHGSTLEAGLTNQKLKLASKCLDLDHASDADDSCKPINPAKEKRRTRAARRVKEEGNLVDHESAENSVQTIKQETKDAESSVGRRSTQIKKMQIDEEASFPEGKEENAKTSEDIAERRQSRAEREIPANQKSLTPSELRLRSSMKNMFNQLALVKESKISEARKLAKVEPNLDSEESEEEDTQTEKMRPQVKTYGGPKVKKVISPQEVSKIKVKSEVDPERDGEGKKARSSSSYSKDLLAFWHDPVLIHKSSSPAGNLSENARRVLSFSRKDKVISDPHQDHEVQKSSGAKGIMKTAPSPGQKKMVRFSDPLL